MSAWAVTSDNGETSRRNVLLADGWEPFSVVVQPETSQWGAWTEIWFRMPPAVAVREGTEAQKPEGAA